MAQYYYVTFNGATSYINCGSDASLDNILTSHTATIEAWVRVHSLTGDIQPFTHKSVGATVAWQFGIDDAGSLYATINTDGVDGDSAQLAAFALNSWAHVVMAYDDTGDRKIYFAVDGMWVAAYGVQTAATGAIRDDSAKSFFIGESDAQGVFFDGDMAWLRISDNIRYPVGVAFTPPVWCIPPAVDANTTELWRMDEGSGLAVAAAVNAANNGTGVALTWAQCFPPATHVINDILFATRSVGYISLVDGSGNPEVWRTIDGGYSWHILPERGGALGSDITTVGVLASCGANHILVGGDTAIVALEG